MSGLEPTPEVVAPLSKTKRQLLFLSLIFIFVISVPVFVFHATGYRYDFFSPERTIVSTGGMYVSIPDQQAQIYIDEVLVGDARTFRRASYIQQLLPGIHRLHVQSEGYQTWVKELPVYPHIVTEAETFLLPVRPQLRIITETVLASTNEAVVSEDIFAFLMSTASTSNAYSTSTLATTTTATATTSTTTRAQTPLLSQNPEYQVFSDRFALVGTTTVSRLDRVIDTARQTIQSQVVPVATTSTSSPATLATTTKQRGKLQLSEQGDDIVVRFMGNSRDIPYYFCVPQISLASTTELYGAQVMRGITTVLADTSESLPESKSTDRICRSEIIIDRQGQEILSFDFINIGLDLVIVHRPDGIFVTEIDDRSWQNTQRLYGPTAEAMIIENNRIYIYDRQGFYAELFTALITPLTSNN